eukprot:gene19144-22929_t
MIGVQDLRNHVFSPCGFEGLDKISGAQKKLSIEVNADARMVHIETLYTPDIMGDYFNVRTEWLVREITPTQSTLELSIRVAFDMMFVGHVFEMFIVKAAASSAVHYSIKEEEEDENNSGKDDPAPPLVETANRAFSLGGNARAIRQGNLIEQFIVVGLSKESNINPNDKVSHDGKLLYSYPPEKGCDPQVIGFCFPDGIKLLQVHRRNSLTEIHAVLFKSLSQLEGSDTSFMFLVTGGEELLYVSCVLNTEPIDELPCFFPKQPEPPATSDQTNNSRPTHFDFIYSILEKPPKSSAKLITQSSSTDLTKLSGSSSLPHQRGVAPSALSRSSMTRIKPLPPIPQHAVLSQSTTPMISGSPFTMSPAASPLFQSAGSMPSETTSLISKAPAMAHIQKVRAAGHGRSLSTPVSNLKAVLLRANTSNAASASSPGTLSDESLSAIQESLSMSDDQDLSSMMDDEEMSDFTSSSNSIDFNDSPNTIQFEDVSTPLSMAQKINSIKETVTGLEKQLEARLEAAGDTTTTSTSDTSADGAIGAAELVSPRMKPLPKLPENNRQQAFSPTLISSTSPPLPPIPESPSQSPSLPPLSVSTGSTSSTSSNPTTRLSASATSIKSSTSECSSTSSTKPLADEEIEIIKYFCSLKVPLEDQKLEVSPPGEPNTNVYEIAFNEALTNSCLIANGRKKTQTFNTAATLRWGDKSTPNNQTIRPPLL